MKKNTLYTVNSHNKKALFPQANVFGLGSSLNNPRQDNFTIPKLESMQQPLPQVSIAGIDHSTMQGLPVNTSSTKQHFMNTKGGKVAGAVMSGLSSGVGSLVSGGFDSTAGNTISNIGSTVGDAISAVNPLVGGIVSLGSNLVGGITSLLGGMKVDKEKLEAANNGTKYLNSFESTADSFDDVNMYDSQAAVQKVYKGGVFARSKARRKNDALKAARNNALAFAENSIENNVNNLAQDQINNSLANYAAYGGPLGYFGPGALGIMQGDKYIDAINNRTNAISKAGVYQYPQVNTNTFGEGGLKAAFLNDFASDPIGAAVRYNKGLEEMAAAQEAERRKEEEEAAMLSSKKLISDLQAQNQELQNLLIANTQNAGIPAQLPTYSSPVSEAAPKESTGSEEVNKNWQTIERALRKSGKFNDTQIEGLRLNIERESGFSPDSIGDGGRAFGLMQWHPGRQPEDRTLEGQINHLIETVANYDGNTHWIGRKNYDNFMNAKTPEEAHYWLARGYERPAQYVLDKLKSIYTNEKALGGDMNEEPTDATRVSKNTILPILRDRDFTDNEYFWNSGLHYPAGLWERKDGYFHTTDAYGDDVILTKEEADSIVNENLERKRRDRIIQALENKKAFGGELGTNGTDFTNGLLYVNAGNTHENNPLGGVPMGVDAEGTPNLVEEGETVYNDYVFSNRLLVPIELTKELGLNVGKKKRISFADASKKMAKESELRPNDPISQSGLEASLARLAEVQEAERTRKQMEEYVGLENEYGLGGIIGNVYDTGGILKWLNDKHPERVNKKHIAKAMEAYLSKNPRYAKAKDFVRYVAAYDAITKGKGNIISNGLRYGKDHDGAIKHFNELVSYGMPRNIAFGIAFKNVDEYLNDMNDPRHDIKRYKEEIAVRNNLFNTLVRNKGKKDASSKVTKENAGITSNEAADNGQKVITTPSTADASSHVSSSGSTHIPSNNKRSNKKTTNGIDNTMVTDADTSKEETTVNTPATSTALFDTIPSYMVDDYNNGLWGYKAQPDESSLQSPIIEGYNNGEWGYHSPWETEQIETPLELPSVLEERKKDLNDPINKNRKKSEDVKTYQTWMRYAPVAGAGLMTLTDLLGLTNKPDYTYANKLEAAANAAGYAPDIKPDYIGDYLTYRPMDVWAEQNRLNATANATNRILRNNGNNPGTIAAGVIANGYNSQLASGELYKKALEYNDTKRKDVAEFNRKTNMFNSQLGLEADTANARYRQGAAQLQLNGLAHAAALREDIDKRIGAAKAANISNLLTSLGNIGRENFAINQINGSRAARNNYYMTKDGHILHDDIEYVPLSKVVEEEEKKKKGTQAFGGRINRSKKVRK